MKIRGALVPAVNLASNAWIFILLIGIFLTSQGLVTLAIVMYAVVVLFQVVTLPVEFNASRRAMAYMDTIALPRRERSDPSMCSARAPSPTLPPRSPRRSISYTFLVRIAIRRPAMAYAKTRAAFASEKLAGSSSDAVTVTEALMIAKGALNGVRLKIVGEVSYVSNKSSYSAVYLNVKDEGGTLDCMVWKDRYAAIGVDLKVGALVELTGYFDIYVKRGSMSFGVPRH